MFHRLRSASLATPDSAIAITTDIPAPEFVLNPVEAGTATDHATYFTAQATRRIGQVATGVSAAFLASGATELARSDVPGGGLLLAAGATAALMAHAMYEDASDKVRMDELTLPYTLRIPAELPHPSNE